MIIFKDMLIIKGSSQPLKVCLLCINDPHKCDDPNHREVASSLIPTKKSKQIYLPQEGVDEVQNQTT